MSNKDNLKFIALLFLAIFLSTNAWAQNYGYGGPHIVYPTHKPPFETPVKNGPKEKDKDNRPKQLFDIRLIIDNNAVVSVKDLSAKVTFDSFGQEPTPVQMKFEILNSSKNAIWDSTDNTTVETSSVFVKKFTDAPQLNQGSYTLKLTTLYNQNVEDTFEAPFDVVVSTKKDSNNLVYWFVGILGLAVFALIIKLSSKKRK